MKPKTETHDVVIVGGGPVGLLLYQLLSDTPYSVQLIEKQAQLINRDARAYILNCQLVDQLIGSSLLKLSADQPLIPLESLIVSSQESPFKFRLTSPVGRGRQPVKYVVGATIFQQSLVASIKTNDILTGTEIDQIALGETAIDIRLKRKRQNLNLKTRVMIVADGAGSPTAAQLEISRRSLGHAHQALVVNLHTNRGPFRQAEQCLTRYGPVSIVPGLNDRLVSVIVSHDQSYLAALNSPDKVTRLLERTYRGRYGRLEQSTPPVQFNVQPQRRVSHHPRVILFGDAACTLSPVAAQGLSLGLNSCLKFTRCLSDQQPDMASQNQWHRFAQMWHDEYRTLYHRPQNLNQLYARQILRQTGLRTPLVTALGVTSLCQPIGKRLFNLLSN